MPCCGVIFWLPMAHLEKLMSKKLSFYTNLIYFITLALFVVVRICSAYNLFAFMGDYASYIMSFVTQIGILLLLPFFLFKFLSKASFKQNLKFFNYKKVSVKTVLLCIVLGVIVYILNIYVSSFFNSIIQFLGYTPNRGGSSVSSSAWWVLILNLICTAVLPAICEETLHRGMLLKGNSPLGMKKSILISGILFGLLHLNIEQFFYASIIGIFLGYLCWCCNSIYPCIIIHFMNNAISVFISFAGAKGWAIGNVYVAISNFLFKNPVLGFVLFMLILILLVIIAFELVNLLIKESFKYNFGKKQEELTAIAIRQSYFQQIDDLKNNEQISPDLEKKVIYIDLKQFIDMVSKEGEIVEEKVDSKADVVDKKLDLKIKILLYGSFILSGIVTLMTFIWGLLR